MSDDDSDFLVLLLDTHLFYEGPKHGGHQIQSESLLEQVLYFVGAYVLLNHNNQLAVLAIHEQECRPLYMSLGNESTSTSSSNPYRSVKEGLLSLLQGEMHKGAPGQPQVSLSCGLSRALCLINRLQAAPARAQMRSHPRILCLMGSPDVPMQYIPIMNAIFSAQRAAVAIDALVLHATDSALLQQAAHITGGLYFRPADRATALQHLVQCLAADTETRKMLSVHQPLGVDFRASCFCHKKTIDIGYVCSVCLSIFCEQAPHCRICGTEYSKRGR